MGAKLRGATLIAAKFIGTNLDGADFSNARFEKTYFLGAVNVPDTVRKRMSKNWHAD